jgi:Na+/melibiose symporter-like transporter
MPVFLALSLNMPSASIALAPCLNFLGSFFGSWPQCYFNRKCGHHGNFLIGTVLTAAALAWSYFLTEDNAYMVYPASFILGLGGSFIMVTSQHLINCLIGKRDKSGAFVFGCMSLTDKISNGLAVLVIQQFRQEQMHNPIADANIITFSYCVVPCVFCILGAMLLMWVVYCSSYLESGKNASIQVTESNDIECKKSGYGSVNDWSIGASPVR